MWVYNVRGVCRAVDAYLGGGAGYIVWSGRVQGDIVWIRRVQALWFVLGDCSRRRGRRRMCRSLSGVPCVLYGMAGGTEMTRSLALMGNACPHGARWMRALRAGSSW